MRGKALTIGLFLHLAASAQLSAGATIGWSRSQHFGRGAPTIGFEVSRSWPHAVSRFSFEQQLPSTQRWYWRTDSADLPVSGGASDGHVRVFSGSDALVMLSCNLDHLFEWEHNGRFRLLIGPGISFASEHYAATGTVEDLSEGTRFTEELRYRRNTSSVRFTAEATYDIGVGELLLDAAADVSTISWRRQDPGTFFWTQRVYVRFGARFPLMKAK